jgi:CheY-like chemotaxis protein
MLSCNEVLVASSVPALADELVEALRDEGALVVCVEEVEAATEVLQAGFRPDAVVVDGALSGAVDLVEHVRHLPGARRIPVLATSPVPCAEELPWSDVILVKRDVNELVVALSRVCDA